MADPPLPGSEIVERGLADLRAGERSIEACLVSMAATRLRELGHEVPAETIPDPESVLYRRLVQELGPGAHSRYNAWRRRLSSFLRAAACVKR